MVGLKLADIQTNNLFPVSNKKKVGFSLGDEKPNDSKSSTPKKEAELAQYEDLSKGMAPSPKPGMVNINSSAPNGVSPRNGIIAGSPVSPKKRETYRSGDNNPKSGQGHLRPNPPNFAFFTNFNSSCNKLPASDRDKSIIPWDHSWKDYLYDLCKFDTSGKLTVEQLRREVRQLRVHRSWNPLTVYRVVMICAFIVTLIVIMSIAVMLSIRDNTYRLVWWAVVIAGLEVILFAVIMVMAAKIFADRLAYNKGKKLDKKLRDCQARFLVDTKYGLRAGLNGAWIEVGNIDTLCRISDNPGNYYDDKSNEKDKDVEDQPKGRRNMLKDKDTINSISKLINSNTVGKVR